MSMVNEATSPAWGIGTLDAGVRIVTSSLQTGYRAWRAQDVQLVAATIGTITLGLTAFRTISTLWAYFRPSAVQVYQHAGKDSWALITGASDGIGRGFAEALLARGFNVIIHGRNPTKLDGVKAELEIEFPGRQILTAVADASTNSNAYEAITQAVRSIPRGGLLTVLVNNIGGVPLKPQYQLHHEIAHEHIDAIINLNARFTAHVTRELLPILEANGPSLVLNCGSLTAHATVPYLSTYAATKGFVEAFTLGLRADMTARTLDPSAASKKVQVHVLGFIIGNVLSGGNKTHVPIFTLTSRQNAEACLNRVTGAPGSGAAMVFPSWRPWLMYMMTASMPQSMRDRITAQEMRPRYLQEREGQK